jgi:exodeoxyribonuclease V alpha subunit
MGSSIAVMAPTGLAQKNLKVYCKYDSKFDDKVMFSTLHRALNFTFNKGEFKPTIMIVDESSMVDLFLFEKLLSACECFRSSLILIGDVKQLPPISAGTPFESIIKSKIFNTTILTNIKRQEGNLKSIIEKMNTENGVHFDDFDNAYSHFIEAKTPEDFERVITEIYEKEHSQHRLQMTTPGVKTTTPHKEFDIHTMSVQREKNGGVFALNPIIQKIKNPHGKKLFVERYENGHTHIFHENDLVIRTENDYKDEKNVRVNGDVGTIHETVKQMKNKYGKNETVYTYTVKYDGETDETDLSVEDVRDAFMPFYVSSVHKMQGLQRNIIVFIVSPAHNFCLMNKNSKKLVYTAISRCRTTFYVVGDKSLFIKAQRAKDEFIYPTLFMNEFYEWVL